MLPLKSLVCHDRDGEDGHEAASAAYRIDIGRAQEAVRQLQQVLEDSAQLLMETIAPVGTMGFLSHERWESLGQAQFILLLSVKALETAA